MKSVLVALWAMAVVGCGAKAEEPIEHPQPSIIPTALLKTYDSLEEAAVYGAQRLYECSHYYECYAVIARNPDGKYVVGPASSDDAGDHTQTNRMVPKSWTLIADIHAHPCLPITHDPAYFSPYDIADNLYKNIPGFMLDECTGKVHEFIPNVTPPNDEQPADDPGAHLTQGKIVGSITVDGKVVEPKTGF